MEYISDRITRLSASETLAMSQKSAELKAQGIDVINLSVGEPDFFTPDHIKQAAQKAIEQNYSFYPPVAGYLSLRQAISHKLKNENNLSFSPEEIICSNGAKQALCNAVLSLVNPGDQVIIPAPCWVSYVEMVKLAEGIPVIVESDIHQNFKITAEQLSRAITPKTRLLILCSPANPTGCIYSAQELKAFAEVLVAHPQVFIIADEIYEHINYGVERAGLAQFEELRGRVAIVNGVSKAYAMTGWRLGWLAGPRWLVSACNKLQGQYSSAPSSIAQKAAEAAYTGPQACLEEMCQAFKRRRDLIVNLAKDIPGFHVNVPEGAFYLFPECSAFFGKGYREKTIRNSADLAMFLLEEAHVACVAGSAFFAPNYIRLSYATSDENIQEAMRRIKTTLAKLK